MIKEVEVNNLIDKAIIKSFDKVEKGMLTRKAIIQSVKNLIGKSEPIIIKRLEKMSAGSSKYLIKTSRGIYKLNPEIKFSFIGEPLSTESKIIEISSKIRAEHTEELKPIIKNWIGNFPEPPCYENSVEFSQKVEKCESFALFNDLLVHLSSTGYDIDQRWKKYKKDVDELERDKGAALKLIEKSISDIFLGLKLTFVKRDIDLGDFDCGFAYMIYRNLIDVRLGETRVDKKYWNISDEDEYYDKYLPEIHGFLRELEIFKDRLNEMGTCSIELPVSQNDNYK